MIVADGARLDPTVPPYEYCDTAHRRRDVMQADRLRLEIDEFELVSRKLLPSSLTHSPILKHECGIPG